LEERLNLSEEDGTPGKEGRKKPTQRKLGAEHQRNYKKGGKADQGAVMIQQFYGKAGQVQPHQASRNDMAFPETNNSREFDIQDTGKGQDKNECRRDIDGGRRKGTAFEREKREYNSNDGEPKRGKADEEQESAGDVGADGAKKIL